MYINSVHIHTYKAIYSSYLLYNILQNYKSYLHFTQLAVS